MKKEWQKKIYIASQMDELDDYGKNIYDTPREYWFNVQPLSSKAEMEMFGQNASEIQRAVISRADYEGMFKEFDVAYLDGATPEGETYNGEKANYRLYPPRNQNVVTLLYFEKLVK